MRNPCNPPKEVLVLAHSLGLDLSECPLKTICLRAKGANSCAIVLAATLEIGEPVSEELLTERLKPWLDEPSA